MRIRNLATMTAIAAATSVLGGCVQRTMVAFQDHPKQPFTNLKVLETTALFWHELVFYSCSDDGKTLACKRACGGATDLGCPKSADGSYEAAAIATIIH